MKRLIPVVAVLLGAGVGCGIGFNGKSSECGGFETVTRALDNNPDCEDEAMHFTWDAESGVVHFVHENVDFNCCGERDIHVFHEDGVYVVYEDESPEGLFGGRCSCYCLYDMAVDFDVGDNRVFKFQVVTDVSDDDEPEHKSPIWDIDVSSGETTIVLRVDVGCYY